MELRFSSPDLSQACDRVCRAVRAAGGRPVLVGGCVRDMLRGAPATDIDIEVYHLAPGRLRTALGRDFRVSLVGESFGVLRLHGVPIDVSVPRSETKRGLGHRGFDVAAAPDMPFETAAGRRDFTINAMGYDSATRDLLDPHGGRADLRARCLRHVSTRFKEDPLRVLRGMQFTARFDLDPAPETIALCRDIAPEGLPAERVFDEWQKLILKGERISGGLRFLRDCGWICYTPELDALQDCPQDPEWHPEGDVWVHTGYCMDAFASERLGDADEDLVVGLAVLCHDLGKPATTCHDRGRIRSPGHEQAGEAPTRAFLARMTNRRGLADAVVPLVTNHLRPRELYQQKAGDAAVRRLARRVGRLDRLVRVVRADRVGTPPFPEPDLPCCRWLLDRARELEVQDSAPEPLVKGRHLIEMGLTPGPHFGTILHTCYEAQLDGEFESLQHGLAYAKARAGEQGEASA